jgi:hypothetical protein
MFLFLLVSIEASVRRLASIGLQTPLQPNAPPALAMAFIPPDPDEPT